jgi:hypothetical protein
VTLYPILASKVVASGQRWLWPGYVPSNAVTLFDGDPGASKSALVLDLCARFTTGRDWPDGSSAQAAGQVIVVNAEDGQQAVRGRLEAAGADLDKVGILSDPFDLGQQLSEVAELLRKDNPQVLVIDPLGSHLHTQAKQSMAGLAALAVETDTAVLIVRHLRRSGGRALYAGSGSIAIVGSARAAYLIGRDPGDEECRVLAPTKMNVGAFPSSMAYTVGERDGFPVLHWRGQAHRTADELVGPAHTGERQDAAAFLLDLLSEGAVASAEVKSAANEASLAWATVRRAKDDLGIMSVKSGFGTGACWLWSLPVEPPKMLTITEGAL